MFYLKPILLQIVSLGSGDYISPKRILDDDYLSLEKTLNQQQKDIFNDLKKKLNELVQESVKESEQKFEDQIQKIRVCLHL